MEKNRGKRLSRHQQKRHAQRMEAAIACGDVKAWKESRDAIFFSCVYFVRLCFRETGYASRHRYDCMQAGFEALLRAIDTYCWRLGYTVLTYSKKCIMRAMRRCYRRDITIAHYPRDSIDCASVIFATKKTVVPSGTAIISSTSNLWRDCSVIDGAFALISERRVGLSVAVNIDSIIGDRRDFADAIERGIDCGKLIDCISRLRQKEAYAILKSYFGCIDIPMERGGVGYWKRLGMESLRKILLV